MFGLLGLGNKQIKKPEGTVIPFKNVTFNTREGHEVLNEGTPGKPLKTYKNSAHEGHEVKNEGTPGKPLKTYRNDTPEGHVVIDKGEPGKPLKTYRNDISAGYVVTKEQTLSEPTEEVTLGQNKSIDMSDIGRLSAFAQSNKTYQTTGALIQEALMEQTVDPSLLKSDDEAYKKGMEKYLYNTDRTWEDVYRPLKTDEKNQQAELDAWQKGMEEYRARWD